MHVCMMNCSDYSAPIMYTTTVAAPSQPDPPMLSEQFVTALTVSWIRRPGDDVFTLNMDDESKVRTSICHKQFLFFLVTILLSVVYFIFSFIPHSFIMFGSRCWIYKHWYIKLKIKQNTQIGLRVTKCQ